jgi:hypothetical protein
MLIGHYAPALVLQRWQPRVPLAVLFIAVQLVDVAWASFVLGGIEHARIVPGWTASNDLQLLDMPYTHSLLAAGLWALGAGVLWFLWRRDPRQAVAVALAVGSHWLLDLPMHKGDLTLAGESTAHLGWGLWQHKGLAFAAELLPYAGAWLLWQRGRTRTAWTVTLGVVGVILTIYSYFGPPPQRIGEMCASALVLYFALAGLAALADRRVPART